ncbi:BRO-N domain-containing protein [Clostridium cellulovorans]|uniref:Prophage antirepressor n=1 Tax=Clostridium cellulovorans (strain ATCC 35296 / DSM 3052 / OCM 3 / 743B) TaxID=573061 RepID=D9SWE4_CLOC7|nr:BRO family protein [Clostridium cellulovorans]ADL53226.1 prophage antirepressor [Clostridium cellulovorans 743B]
MNNEIKIFQNSEIGEVRTILNDDGSISVNAEDVARGFGWSRIQSINGKDYESIRWERMNAFINELGFHPQVGEGDFIPETLFYLLGMKANNETAQKFQMWLAKDVIPSIRKYGLYITEELLRDKERMLDTIKSCRSDLMSKDAEINYLERQLKPYEDYIHRKNVINCKLRPRTGQTESYITDLLPQILLHYIKTEPKCIISENEEIYILNAKMVIKELRKLIYRRNDIIFTLLSFRCVLENNELTVEKTIFEEESRCKIDLSFAGQ